MQDRTQGVAGPVGLELSLDRCLVDGDASHESRARRKAFGASLTIETAVLALILVSPLFAGIAQPQLHPLAPMPIILGVWQVHHPNQPSSPTHTTSPHPYTVRISEYAFPVPHAKVPDAAEPSNGESVDPPGENIPGMIPVPGIGGSPPKVDPPRVERRISPENQPLKVSEGVEQAQLISRIEPRYPPLAKETRTQGTVFLHAIISREGRITSLEVLSGHPLLVPAALDAVRQWRYHPTLLNGEPVEVETSITVIFRLSN